MNIKDISKMAIEGMRERKTRVALNVVGILIGISAIVALTSITQGMSASITEQLEFLGPTSITVTSGGGGFGMGAGMGAGMGGGGGGGGGRVPKELTFRDVEQVQGVSDITVATPVLSGSAEARMGGYSDVATVYGIVPEEYQQVNLSIEVESGRFLKRSDAASAVVGAHIANPPNLDEPLVHIGDRITLLMGEKSITLRVAGILTEVGGMLSTDNQIFVTTRIAQLFFDSGNKVDQILIMAEDVESVDGVVEEVQEELGEGVTVISSGFIMDTIGNITGILEAVLGGIASISLIVAGIAIINTMTISVMERTREIGILKALGAKSRTVLLMFLTESLLTGLIGGLIGVVLGVILSQIMSVIFSSMFQIDMTPAPSLVIGVLGISFAIITGVLSGLYPARKASKMNPVEALRYE